MWPDPTSGDGVAEQRSALLRGLEELHRLLDGKKYGIARTEWTLTQPGAEPRAVTLTSYGRFMDTVFRLGTRAELQTELVFPKSHNGLLLAGDELRVDVFSRFPITVRVNGEVVFGCDGPPNAAGVASVSLVKEIEPGCAYPVTLVVDVPDRLIAFGLVFRMSTRSGRRRWHRADAAWARLLLAASRISSPAELAAAGPLRRLLEHPVGVGRDSFTERLEEVAAPLAATVEPEPPVPVHLIGHAHVDIEWLWGWEHTERCFADICATAVDAMRDIPEMSFSLAQAELYEGLARRNPELFADVIELVRAGRWEPMTSMWVEGDVVLPDGESLARQFEHGHRFAARHLPSASSVCSLADNFGLTPQLPQILRRSGLRAFYHMRSDPLPDRNGGAYRWVAPDGSSAIGITTSAYDGGLMASRVARAAVRARRHGLSAGVLLYGVDGHGGRNLPEDIGRMLDLSERPWFPNSRFGTLDGYVDAIAGDPLPEFRGEGPTVFEGTYTSLADIKQRHRRGEIGLTRAERLGVLAGTARPGALDEAWRTLLHLQHHDTIGGTSSATEQRFDEQCAVVENGIRHEAGAALDALAGAAEPEEAARVVNPLPWARDVLVEVPVAVFGLSAPARLTSVVTEDGTVGDAQVRGVSGEGGDKVAFVTRLAPWQARTVRLTAAAAPIAPVWELSQDRPAELLVGEQHPKQYFSFRNRFFSGAVRGDSGAIVSLVDSATGRQWVDHGMPKPATTANTARPDLGLNVVQLLTSRPHAMSAWHYHEVAEEISLIDTGESAWIERGTVLGTLRTVHQIGPSTIISDLTVYRDLPFLDVRLGVDWRHPAAEGEPLPSLKVAFTPWLRDPRLHVGAPFGVSRRYCTGQESPFQQWIDVSDDLGGLTLLADDRYGYDALGPRVRISLVRSAYDPTLNRDLRRHRFAYTMVPHVGDWVSGQAPMLAEERAQRPVVTAARGAPRIFPMPQLDPATGAMITCMKPAAALPGEIVVRVRQWSGAGGNVELTGFPEGTVCRTASLTEIPEAPLPVTDGRVRLTLVPGQVQTLLLRLPA